MGSDSEAWHRRVLLLHGTLLPEVAGEEEVGVAASGQRDLARAGGKTSDPEVQQIDLVAV